MRISKFRFSFFLATTPLQHSMFFVLNPNRFLDNIFTKLEQHIEQYLSLTFFFNIFIFTITLNKFSYMYIYIFLNLQAPYIHFHFQVAFIPKYTQPVIVLNPKNDGAEHRMMSDFSLQIIQNNWQWQHFPQHVDLLVVPLVHALVVPAIRRFLFHDIFIFNQKNFRSRIFTINFRELPILKNANVENRCIVSTKSRPLSINTDAVIN